MRTASLLMLVLTVAVVALSCGQKQLEEVAVSAPFMSSLADAKDAAAGGKSIVIDFYTDW